MVDLVDMVDMVDRLNLDRVDNMLILFKSPCRDYVHFVHARAASRLLTKVHNS